MPLLKLEPEWVTLPSDKALQEKEPQATVPEYQIGPLDLADREMVLNLLGMREPPWGTIVMTQARGGLKGWRKQFLGGVEVKFKPDKDGKASVDQLAMLESRTLHEIARDAWARSTVSEATRGN